MPSPSGWAGVRGLSVFTNTSKRDIFTRNLLSRAGGAVPPALFLDGKPLNSIAVLTLEK